ncbi:MAG TPA: T9SS type A sorting domain-containing protein, partial [Bacteroidales bacterium]|nr:T9SS type A sorting domain-containing protein [Bacteroidales bacterium]
WIDGNRDGEMIATNYTFLYNTNITSMDIYIGSQTTAGTQIIGHVMEYNDADETWVDISATALYEIQENVLGSWVNLTFTDPVAIDLAGEDGKSVKAAIEFYYGSTSNKVWIGVDPTVKDSFWGVSWFLVTGSSANTWYSFTNWANGGLGVRLLTDDADLTSVTPVATDNTTIYPNPSNGIINIDNIEGASVEVMNVLGQTVESIEIASAHNTIDMSSYAAGTYVVRIVNGANVTTHKVNITK